MNSYFLRVEVFNEVSVDVYVFDFYAINSPDWQKLILANSCRLSEIFSKCEVRIFIYSERDCYVDVFSNKSYFLPNIIVSGDFCRILEVGFLPGVTDVAGNVVKRLAHEIIPEWKQLNLSVHSSKMFLSDNFTLPNDFNELVQYAKLITYNKQLYTSISVSYICSIIDAQKTFDSINDFLFINSNATSLSPKVEFLNLDTTDENLENMGVVVGLSLEDMRAIKVYVESDKARSIKGCRISDVELEAIGQSWSEHCCHKIFSSPIDGEESIFRKYISGATKKINSPECVSVFSDNAGAVVFDDNFLIAEKVETHNSPSALDPFGGAMTGVLGVNRDILGFGLGAKPVMNSYYFCFAEQAEETLYRKVFEKKELALSPKFIHDGVIKGVNVGGNCSGIPTMQGGVYFNRGFRGKPLVFVGCSGLIPRKVLEKESHVKATVSGDLIVVIGGRVGLDGIHGATFSSDALGDNISSSVVQIGDPFTQKKFIDAIVREARDAGVYNSMTDNGAGGLSSSVGEMGYEGFSVDLEKVPLKVAGMSLSPWQIWVSESQERMTLSVPKNKYDLFCALMEKYEVEVSCIGVFNKSNRGIIKYNGDVVMDLSTSFIHKGRPIEHLRTREIEPRVINFLKEPIKKLSLNEDILKVLGSSNICSKEYIAMQYDHEVQGTSVIKPIQGIGRIYSESISYKPLLSSKRCVVRSSALGSSYGEVDTYHMSACAIDQAIKNCVSIGADVRKLAMLDNFCWSNSKSPERLWQLKQSAIACYDYAVAFGVPFVSGKDSMFNDFVGYCNDSDKKIKISAPPSLLISVFGVKDNYLSCKSLDAKSIGDEIYLLGITNDELYCSEYQRICGINNQKLPKVEADVAMLRYKSYFKALDYINSAIPVNAGGLIIAIAKKLIGGNLGAKIDLSKVITSSKFDIREILFSETQSRILVTVPQRNSEQFGKCFLNQYCAKIGRITEGSSLNIDGITTIDLVDMSTAYKAMSNSIINRVNC